jgi:hypothetical protein
MARLESMDAPSRGQKRLRPENQSFASTATPEISRKRRRLAEPPKSFVGRIRNALIGFIDYFWGKSSLGDSADMSDSEEEEIRLVMLYLL